MILNLSAWCYRLVLFPLAFILTHLFWWIIPIKLRASVTLKWQKPRLNKHSISTIMIHAASGEIEYAKPLIRQLQLQFPSQRILVTYSSPSIHRLINVNELIDVIPLPFDFYFLMKAFLIQQNIKQVFIARSDVWLNLTWACKDLNIGCFLFAATQSQPIKYLKSQQLQFLTQIFTVTNEDKKYLDSRLKLPISTIGDPRFDQVFYRLAHPKKLPKSFNINNSSNKIFIAGSLWSEDWSLIGPLLPDLLSHNYQIILVPHEVDAITLDWFEKELSKLQLAYIKLQNYPSNTPFQILLFDQVGYLAELYHLTHVTFVGGSFKAKVHSVMEPLAAGNLVLVGPFHHNNREALEFKQLPLGHICQIKAVTEIKNLQQAQDFFELINSIDLIETKNQIRTLSLKKQGATQSLINLTRD